MSFKKESAEFKMFGDYYNITKKYWNCDGSPKQCEDALNDIERFYEKYKDEDRQTRIMSLNLGKAFIGYLEQTLSESKI